MTAETQTPEIDGTTIALSDPSLYTNREQSWQDFNDRVLWEAKDPRNPLIERIRCLSITASNLDEFVSKRMGWLRLSMKADPAHRTVDGLTIADQLVAVRERVQAMQRDIDETWRDTLEPALAATSAPARGADHVPGRRSTSPRRGRPVRTSGSGPGIARWRRATPSGPGSSRGSGGCRSRRRSDGCAAGRR